MDAIHAYLTLSGQYCDSLGGLVRHWVLVPLPGGTDPGDLAHEDLWRLVDASARRQGVDLLAIPRRPS